MREHLQPFWFSRSSIRRFRFVLIAAAACFSGASGTFAADTDPIDAITREFSVYVGNPTATIPRVDAITREFTVYVSNPTAAIPRVDAITREFSVYVGNPTAIIPSTDAISREFIVGVSVVAQTPTPTPSPTPFNDAVFLGNSVPPQIATDHGWPVQITARNTGNTVWTAGMLFALQATSDTCNLIPSNSVDLAPSAAVDPGADYTFSTILQGPSAPGSCELTLQMGQNGNLFGPVFQASVNVVTAVNDASALGHTIPALLAPGSSLGVGVTFKNTGNTVWYGGSTFALKVLQDTCSMIGLAEIPIQVDQITTPNQVYQFIFQLTAPPTEGPCTLQFSMTDSGTVFGETQTVNLTIAIPPNAARGWENYE